MLYPATSPSAPWLLLAHGAGAGQGHPWMTAAAHGLSTRGVNVVTFDFPYKAAGRRVPDPARVLEDAFGREWRVLPPMASADGGAPPQLFAGGKSMGGRMASQVAAAGGFSPAPAGLVFFGYPLHPPGKPLQRRDRHLIDVAVPMLFLHGTRDPFGSPDEMRALAERLPGATLELIAGGDHSLVSGRGPQALASLSRVLDLAATWIARTASAPPRA